MFVLVRDGEAGKVHVYNHLTPEAAEILEFLGSHLDIFSIYKSDKPYDPAIAYQFLQTGDVNEEHLARSSE